MRYYLFLLSCLFLNFACEPGETPPTSAPISTTFKGDADALGEALGQVNQELAKNKNSIEEARSAFEKATDLTAKSEQLLNARIAENLLAAEGQKLSETKLQALENQVRQALAKNREDKDVKEADRIVKDLRAKFNKAKEELAKTKAIGQKLEDEEKAIVNKEFGVAPTPVDIKGTEEKANEAKAELEQAQKALDALPKPDAKLDKALTDLNAANTTTEIKEAAKGALEPQVIDAALSADKKDPAALVKSLEKVTDSIVDELVKAKLDDAKMQESLGEKNLDLIKDKIDEAQNSLKAQIDPIDDATLGKVEDSAKKVVNFKPSGLGLVWDDDDKQNFLKAVNEFTGLLVAGSYSELENAVSEFTTKGFPTDQIDTIKNKVRDLIGKINSKLKEINDNKEKLKKNKPIDYKKVTDAIEKYGVELRESIKNRIGTGPFDAPEKVLNAAGRLVGPGGVLPQTMGYEAKINAVFADTLEAQKNSLMNAIIANKKAMEARLSTAEAKKNKAEADFNTAEAALNKAKQAGAAASSALDKTQKENMAQFLLGADIDKLVTLLKEPNKYGSNAKLITFIAKDIATRISHKSVPQGIFLITDKPVKALIDELQNQKASWNLVPKKAMKNTIESLQKLLEQNENTKAPMDELSLILQLLIKNQ